MQPQNKHMQQVTNPFFIKGKIPSAYFCDRESETADLTRKITNGHNVVLISPRRIGKTGLIQHFYEQESIANQYYTFFVDILQTTCLQEFTYLLGQQIFEVLKPRSKKMMELFIQTVRSISTEFGYDLDTGLPKFNLSLGAIEDPQITLSEIFQYIEKADKPCIIAIDEFQRIANYPEKNVEAILRTHIQQMGNCSFIFAGSERHLLSDMFYSYARPFYNSTSSLNLDVFSKAIYISFAKSLFGQYNKSIQEENIEKVYDLFSGNTFCMQKTLNVAFSLTDTQHECTYDILAMAIEEILSDSERDFQNRLSNLNPMPKQLLFAIANDHIAEKVTSASFIKRHKLASASSVQSAIKQLLSDDWISFDQAKRYFVSDQFLGLWLRKNFGSGYQL